jgi:nucleoside-diphosphate-sugar epimerase
MSKSWADWEAYRNRKVLITGGAGFIGVNLALALQDSGARVTIIDIHGPERYGYLSSTLQQIEYIRADMRDEQRVESAVGSCDIIFNLAGRSGATASNSSPFDDLSANGYGQLTLLEACRKCNPDVKILFPSSRLVYEPMLSTPVAETATTAPTSIYGIHKLLGEHYHRLYGHLYGLRTTILRITNPYGPHQRVEQQRFGVVNWFIHLALAGQTIPVYGSGSQLRDYIHINDVIRAFLWCGIDERADGKIFNVGSGKGTRFLTMANAIVALAGRGRVEHVAWPASAKQSESGDFVADITLIERTIDWRPQMSFEEGCKQVIEYYRQQYS